MTVVAEDQPRPKGVAQSRLRAFQAKLDIKPIANGLPFFFFVVYMISFYLHMPSRIPGIGQFRPDLLLAVTLIPTARGDQIIEVSAEMHDRFHTPLSVELPASLRKHKHFTLKRLDNGFAAPVQVSWLQQMKGDAKITMMASTELLGSSVRVIVLVFSAIIPWLVIILFFVGMYYIVSRFQKKVNQS